MSAKKTSKQKKTRVRKTEKSGAKTSTKTGKKSSYRKGSLGDSIREHFDSVGVDEATYDDCFALALKIMPQTKFNKSHFSWYKNDYRKREEAAAAKKKRSKK